MIMKREKIREEFVCNRLRQDNFVRRSSNGLASGHAAQETWREEVHGITRFRWHVYVNVKISSDDEWFFTDDTSSIGFEEGEKFIQEGGDCDRIFF